MRVCVAWHGLCLQGSEEGIRFPRAGFTDGCESPDGFRELNPGPLLEQQVYLNR